MKHSKAVSWGLPAVLPALCPLLGQSPIAPRKCRKSKPLPLGLRRSLRLLAMDRPVFCWRGQKKAVKKVATVSGENPANGGVAGGGKAAPFDPLKR